MTAKGLLDHARKDGDPLGYIERIEEVHGRVIGIAEAIMEADLTDIDIIAEALRTTADSIETIKSSVGHPMYQSDNRPLLSLIRQAAITSQEGALTLGQTLIRNYINPALRDTARLQGFVGEIIANPTEAGLIHPIRFIRELKKSEQLAEDADREINERHGVIGQALEWNKELGEIAKELGVIRDEISQTIEKPPEQGRRQ